MQTGMHCATNISAHHHTFVMSNADDAMITTQEAGTINLFHAVQPLIYTSPSQADTVLVNISAIRGAAVDDALGRGKTSVYWRIFYSLSAIVRNIFDAHEGAAPIDIAKTSTKRGILRDFSAFVIQAARDSAGRFITGSVRSNPRHIMDKRFQTRPAGAAPLRHIQHNFKYI